MMVCNARGKSEIVSELNLFLKDGAPKFVDWLWEMLADRNPARTHSAFEASKDEDADMDGELGKADRRRIFARRVVTFARQGRQIPRQDLGKPDWRFAFARQANSFHSAGLRGSIWRPRRS